MPPESPGEDPPPTSGRLCVYTSLIGGYESLNEQPVAARSTVPFFCLTDDPALRSETWRLLPVTPLLPMDPIRSQRDLKLRPHRLAALAGFEWSLYIDNAVLLHAPPEAILERLGWPEQMALPQHSFRASVLDEFLEVASLGLDDAGRISEQLNHSLLTDPAALEETPYWCGMLLRRHAAPPVVAAMELWFTQVLRYARRDQLSANSSFRAAGLAPQPWPIDNTASWFHSWPHDAGRNRNAGTRNPLRALLPLPSQLRQAEQSLAAAEARLALTEADRAHLAAAHADLTAQQTALAGQMAAAEAALAEARAQAASAAQSLLAAEAARHAAANQCAEANAGRAAAEASAAQHAAAAEAARAALNLTRNSHSWRATAPLRALRGLLAGAKTRPG